MLFGAGQGYIDRVQVEGLLVAETPFVSVIDQSTNNLRGRREEQRILPRIVFAFLWGEGSALARLNDCNQKMQRDWFVVGGNVRDKQCP